MYQADWIPVKVFIPTQEERKQGLSVWLLKRVGKGGRKKNNLINNQSNDNNSQTIKG
jgi:hypothetical protein